MVVNNTPLRGGFAEQSKNEYSDEMELILGLFIVVLLLVLVAMQLRNPVNMSAPDRPSLNSIDAESLRKSVGDQLFQDNNQTQRSLNDIRERLVLVQSAQSQLRTLSGQMASLEKTLGSGATRGLFGEQQLEELVTAILPQQRLAFQTRLSNGKRPDLLIKLPNPPGPIVVDAKFPLNAFEELQQANTPQERRAAAKRLERHLIGHIRDIAERYIIPGETADQAMLFLPSDALFAAVHSEARGAIEESHRRRVWITAPSTLAATLTTLRAVVRDIETADNLSQIQSEVTNLLDDLERITSAITALDRHFVAAQRDVDQIRALRDSLGNRSMAIANPEANFEPHRIRQGRDKQSFSLVR